MNSEYILVVWYCVLGISTFHFSAISNNTVGKVLQEKVQQKKEK